MKINFLKKFRTIIQDWSDVGQVRDNNEDFAWSGMNNVLDSLLIVADGVGSYAGSDLAAKVVCKTFIKSFDQLEYLKTDLQTWFEINVHKAKRVLHEHVLHNRSHRDMSTTLVLAIKVKNKIHVFWIGDSRAYLLTPKEAVQLTNDHNLMNHLISIDASEENFEKYANSLGSITNSIDADITKKQKFDHLALDFEPDSFIFLASDGFYNFFEMNNLFNEVLKSVAEKKVCQKLVDNAIANGSFDNISFSYYGQVK